ncbi:MAG: ECF transporter S component, partial [Clostridia bacterium]
MKRMDTLRLTRIGMMAAISTVLGFFPEIPLAFLAPWLKLDFSYVPMLLVGFAMGPIAGIGVLVVKDLILLLSSNSGGVGQLADFLMGVSILLPTVLVYQRYHTRKGVLCGMCAGIVAMVI